MNQFNADETRLQHSK